MSEMRLSKSSKIVEKKLDGGHFTKNQKTYAVLQRPRVRLESFTLYFTDAFVRVIKKNLSDYHVGILHGQT